MAVSNKYMYVTNLLKYIEEEGRKADKIWRGMGNPYKGRGDFDESPFTSDETRFTENRNRSRICWNALHALEYFSQELRAGKINMLDFFYVDEKVVPKFNGSTFIYKPEDEDWVRRDMKNKKTKRCPACGSEKG